MSHLAETSNMTTRRISQLPRPDLHRQDTQPCGLQHRLRRCSQIKAKACISSAFICVHLWQYFLHFAVLFVHSVATVVNPLFSFLRVFVPSWLTLFFSGCGSASCPAFE